MSKHAQTISAKEKIRSLFETETNGLTLRKIRFRIGQSTSLHVANAAVRELIEDGVLRMQKEPGKHTMYFSRHGSQLEEQSVEQPVEPEILPVRRTILPSFYGRKPVAVRVTDRPVSPMAWTAFQLVAA